MRLSVWVRIVLVVILFGWCASRFELEEETEPSQAVVPELPMELRNRPFGDRHLQRLRALETSVRSLRSTLDGAEHGLDDLPQVFRSESDRRELDSWCRSWDFQMDNIPAPPERDRSDPNVLETAASSFRIAYGVARGVCARSKSLPTQFEVYKRLMRARGRLSTAENYVEAAIKMSSEN